MHRHKLLDRAIYNNLQLAKIAVILNFVSLCGLVYCRAAFGHKAYPKTKCLSKSQLIVAAWPFEREVGKNEHRASQLLFRLAQHENRGMRKIVGKANADPIP